MSHSSLTIKDRVQSICDSISHLCGVCSARPMDEADNKRLQDLVARTDSLKSVKEFTELDYVLFEGLFAEVQDFNEAQDKKLSSTGVVVDGVLIFEDFDNIHSPEYRTTVQAQPVPGVTKREEEAIKASRAT